MRSNTALILREQDDGRNPGAIMKLPALIACSIYLTYLVVGSADAGIGAHRFIMINEQTTQECDTVLASMPKTALSN